MWWKKVPDMTQRQLTYLLRLRVKWCRDAHSTAGRNDEPRPV